MLLRRRRSFRDALRADGAPIEDLAAVDQAVTLLRMEDGTTTPQRALQETLGPKLKMAYAARRGLSLESMHRISNAGAAPDVVRQEPDVPGRIPPADPGVPPLPLIAELQDFMAALKKGVLLIPHRTWWGTYSLTPVTPAPKPTPALFLVEVYRISSRYGDYGLGRTIRTFTLLPGEKTEISVETWRTSEERKAASTSIVDSFSQEAADRFLSELRSGLSTRTTDDKMDSFEASATAKGWVWGVFAGGELTVTTGGTMQHHTGREDFAETANNTVSEHTQRSNSARENTVTESSERSVATGESSRTTRTIANVNMRRTLNFVFRELNQEYETRVHLVELRVGFSNGQMKSWRETSLSGLRPFLEGMLRKDVVDKACQEILKLASIVFDRNDKPIGVLQTLTEKAHGQDWTKADAAPDGNGDFRVPGPSFVYRFKRGSLGQDGDDWEVDGVVLKENTVVLRTDSLVAEALLGQADALDAYAMETQAADAAARTLRNTREELAQETLGMIDDGKERSEAFEEMFNHDERLAIDLNRVQRPD